MDKTKLLWHSNAPHAPTGYGQQTALFVPRLAEHYDLQISAFYGLEAAPMVWQGIKMLPGDGRGYGLGGLTQHAERFFDGDRRGGLIFTLMDVWVLEPRVCAGYDMICWVPVDHEPAPPKVVDFFRTSGSVPLAMTRQGAEDLREFDPLYCPHAVETQVFRPLGRELARKKLGIPQDVFLVGMVGANKGNPSRKSFVASLEAFAEFRRNHENAQMYLHTELTGELAMGVPLPEVMVALDLPEESIRFGDQYRIRFDPIGPQLMALLYSAMDVLVNPSTGGGFEIPMLEAQACGVPVITTDWTAMREVCGAGWRVGGQRTWTPQNSWQILPEPQELLRALEQCYAMSEQEWLKLSSQARSFALRYDVDRVFEDHMLPSIQAAQERLERRREVVTLKAAA